MDAALFTDTANNTTASNSQLPICLEDQILGYPAPYIVAVSAISLVGTFGNLLFLLSFVKERRLRTVSNYVVGHLALVDMLTCCVVIPWTLSVSSGTTSIVSCQFLTRLVSLFPHLSMQTQCLISCNRYFLVTRSRIVYQKWFKRSYTLTYLITGWVFAVSVVIAIACFGEKPVQVDLEYCNTRTDVTGSRRLNYYVLTVLSFLYFVIALVFYGNLIRYVRSHTLTLDLNRRLDTKTSMTLFVLLCFFAASLLISPLGLYLNSAFKGSNQTVFDTTHQCITLILMMNYCVNPVFYGFRLRHFRETVKRMFFCRPAAVHPLPLVHVLPVQAWVSTSQRRAEQSSA